MIPFVLSRAKDSMLCKFIRSMYYDRCRPSCGHLVSSLEHLAIETRLDGIPVNSLISVNSLEGVDTSPRAEWLQLIQAREMTDIRKAWPT